MKVSQAMLVTLTKVSVDTIYNLYKKYRLSIRTYHHDICSGHMLGIKYWDQASIIFYRFHNILLIYVLCFSS